FSNSEILSPTSLPTLFPYTTLFRSYEALAASASGNGIPVSSPMGGYLKNILVDNGAYVTAGQAVATVTSTRRLRLRADLPEIYADRKSTRLNSSHVKSRMPSSA